MYEHACLKRPFEGGITVAFREAKKGEGQFALNLILAISTRCRPWLSLMALMLVPVSKT